MKWILLWHLRHNQQHYSYIPNICWHVPAKMAQNGTRAKKAWHCQNGQLWHWQTLGLNPFSLYSWGCWLVNSIWKKDYNKTNMNGLNNLFQIFNIFSCYYISHLYIWGSVSDFHFFLLIWPVMVGKNGCGLFGCCIVWLDRFYTDVQYFWLHSIKVWVCPKIDFGTPR